ALAPVDPAPRGFSLRTDTGRSRRDRGKLCWPHRETAGDGRQRLPAAVPQQRARLRLLAGPHGPRPGDRPARLAPARALPARAAVGLPPLGRYPLPATLQRL